MPPIMLFRHFPDSPVLSPFEARCFFLVLHILLLELFCYFGLIFLISVLLALFLLLGDAYLVHFLIGSPIEYLRSHIVLILG